MARLKPQKLTEEDIGACEDAYKFLKGYPPSRLLISKLCTGSTEVSSIGSFQQDFLAWKRDILKILVKDAAIIPVKVLHIDMYKDNDETIMLSKSRTIKYKRVDYMTVVAIVIFHDQNLCAVLNNDGSECFWKIMGLFSLRDARATVEKSGFVDFEFIESSEEFTRNRGLGTPDDKYWEMYDEQANEESGSIAEPHLNIQAVEDFKSSERSSTLECQKETDDDYWEKMATQPQQVGEKIQKPELIDLFIGLVELYIDCGAVSKHVIAADLLDISKGIERKEIGIPLLSHRHAVRTLKWAMREYGDIGVELSSALEALEKF